MNLTTLRVLYRLRNIREAGMTMIELVVALVLLTVVTGFTTATILNTTTTSDNFNRGVQNEGKLLDAVSLISRDVSLAKEFKYASDDALSLVTTDSGTKSQVFYFMSGKNPTSDTFDDVDVSKIPDGSGIIEYRIVNGNKDSPIVRNLIPGYNPGGNASNSLFTYYDTSAKEVLLDAGISRVSDDLLPTIRRVELHLTSYIENRDNAMELQTSAVPRLMGLTSSSQANSGTAGSNKLSAPVLNGKLEQRSNKADLWWSSVAGADSYVLYGSKDSSSSWKEVSTVENSSGKIEHKQEDLKWGSDYSYRVVAIDHRGPSDYSNSVTMRVTPQPTKFININPKRGQNGDSTDNYTVARDLKNALAWEKKEGPYTKYRVTGKTNSSSQKDVVEGAENTISTDPGKSYGDVTTYKAIAYNDIVSVTNPDGTTFKTGGEAIPSEPVDLISPPIAPKLKITEANDLENSSISKTPLNRIEITNGSSIKTEKGFVFKSGENADEKSAYVKSKKSANANSWDDNMTGHVNYANNKGWGTRSYYFTNAYNDAGDSPVTKAGAANQPPGPYEIADLSTSTKYANFRSELADMNKKEGMNQLGSMSGQWTTSLGATTYDMRRKIDNNFGKKTVPSSIINSESSKNGITGNSIAVDGISPGVVYGVTMTAKSETSGKSRSIKSTFLSSPDVPKSGILELVCYSDGKTGDDQNFAMYVEANTNPYYGVADKVLIRYYRANGPATTVDTKENIGTKTLAFQRLPSGIGDRGKIGMQLYMSEARIKDYVADFGTTERERYSEQVWLDIEQVQTYSVACDQNYGKSVDGLDSKWVVHQYVCYGFRAGYDYGKFWVLDKDPFDRGYTTADRNKEISSGRHSRGEFVTKFENRGTHGCIWRLDPGIGAEPRWNAVPR